MRSTMSKSDYGEDGVLQRVNKKSRLWDRVVTRGFIETSPFLFQWTGISTKWNEPALICQCSTQFISSVPKSVTESTKNIVQRAEERFFYGKRSNLTAQPPDQHQLQNRVDRVILGTRIKVLNKYLYCLCSRRHPPTSCCSPHVSCNEALSNDV